MEDTNLAYRVLGMHFTLVMKKSAPLNVSKLLSLFFFYKVWPPNILDGTWVTIKHFTILNYKIIIKF